MVLWILIAFPRAWAPAFAGEHVRYSSDSSIQLLPLGEVARNAGGVRTNCGIPLRQLR